MKKKIENEQRRKSELINQAGLMMAAFSFSTTALFSVWEVGLEYIDRVPDWQKHAAIGLITVFLLLSIMYAAIAIFPTKQELSLKVADNLRFLRESNIKRIRNIRKSIISFFIALGLVFVFAISILLFYYIFAL